MKENYGQMAITDEDIKRVPNIITDYDNVSFPGKNKIGLNVIRYEKQYKDSTNYYVEEIRTGKKTLTIQTMYKNKKGQQP